MITTIVFFQVVIIGFLVLNILDEKKKEQRVYIPEGGYKVVASPSGFLNFFFEPKPGIQTMRLDWLGKGFEYAVKHHINNDTLNQIDEVEEKKPENVIRIVTLGASYTFGANVNTQDTYPSQLQSILNRECSGVPRYEVINLGVFGYDLQYSVERFRVRGVKYDPDIVLWYLTPDNFDLIKEINGEKVTKKPDEEELLRIQGWHLRNLDNYFKKDLIFVSMPSFGWKYSRVLNSVKSVRLHTYVYRDSPDVVRMKDVFPDLHPNEKGYYKIAYDLYKYLKDEKIIKCN